MKNKPRIIAFVGPDGCGKSTLARMAAEEMTRHGFQAQIVWSRFNNYFSKPLLGLTRLTGHNRREVHDGTEFGYHDFQSSGWLRYPFIFLQTIDVNIATFIKIKRPEKKTDILVFERSPWDTLADIIVDTGCINLATNYWGRLITAQIRGCDRVFYINRSKELILRMRPELKYDKTLDRKIAIYSKLATTGGWLTLDNNRPLEIVKQELIKNCKVIKVD